ncbi:MAG TPA: patatin-like phospholipase family protein [Thermoanaerobaculia bacterium]|jgi:predicted acylesterase/phospholipase RssA|nr:patatin-like phospholipase family protein [Thermoanaerobaculia bacterium]
MTDGERQHGIVLSGGGANGAYEVGVLKALLAGLSPATGYRPIAPSVYAGTSIGSYNAAFMVGQWDSFGPTSTGNLERSWLEVLAQNPGRYGNGAYRFRGDPVAFLAPSSYMPNPLQPFLRVVQDGAFLTWDAMQRAVHLVTNPDQSLGQRAVDLFDFTAFISTGVWQRSIKKTIDFEGIRRSSRRLRIAATNWNTGALNIFTNLDMTDRLGPLAIQASGAIPGVFPPVLVGAEPYVDGGVLMNTPLKLAVDAGARVLHVIYLDPDVRSIPLGALHSTLGTIYRQQTIGWARVVNDDIGDAAAINEGLDLMARVQKGEEITDPEVKELAKVLAIIWVRLRQNLEYAPLTIHRYHPRDDLGGGAGGALNLERSHLEELIKRGLDDAVTHDCVSSGCVLLAADKLEAAAGAPPVRVEDLGR